MSNQILQFISTNLKIKSLTDVILLFQNTTSVFSEACFLRYEDEFSYTNYISAVTKHPRVDKNERIM